MSRISIIKIGFPILIAILVLLCFSPALYNGFVAWDDTDAFLKNPHYRGMSWDHLQWMFTTFHQGHYQPLSWVTLGLDYTLWGMNPAGYHLTSMLLHTANAILLYFLILALLRIVFAQADQKHIIFYWAAMAGALLFALHPLRVESVAWATERRDVLSGLFFLLSLLMYVHKSQASTSKRKWLLLSLLFFVLSLSSKAWAITLPVVLIILDIYPLRRFYDAQGQFRWRIGLLVEKIPYCIFAFAAAVMASFAQQEAGATRTFDSYTFIERCAQALYGLCFYVWKTISPFNLSPIYELPIHINPLEWQYLVCGVIVIAVTIILFWIRQRCPYLLVAWLCYAIIVSPVLGFRQSGPQMVADRYSYISCMPWAILASGLVYGIWYKKILRPVLLLVFHTALLLIMAILGTLTFFQTQVWKDSLSLWSHAVKSVPTSYMALTSLSLALERQGEVDEAIQYSRLAIAYHPYYANAYVNLAILYEKKGMLSYAIANYHKSLAVDPTNFKCHNNLGNLYRQIGNSDLAILHYHKAMQIERNVILCANLGRTYIQKGWTDKAILLYHEAWVMYRQDNDELAIQAKINIIADLAQIGQNEAKAIPALQEALSDINPDIRNRASLALENLQAPK